VRRYKRAFSQSVLPHAGIDWNKWAKSRGFYYRVAQELNLHTFGRSEDFKRDGVSKTAKKAQYVDVNEDRTILTAAKR